jgi:GTP-binding protein Era
LSEIARANHCGYVALVGRPNVGKSSLLNRLIGQKLAITSHKPQTTRHTILGIHTRTGGQLLYVDTPGIHQRVDSKRRALGHYLNRAAKAMLADVDLIVLLVEALRWTEEDEQVIKALAETQRPVVLAVNKVDRLTDKTQLLPFLQQMASRYAFTEIIPVSATKGINTDKLENLLLGLLPESDNLFGEDELTDRSERFFAAELLREQLTRRYAQEIPYALTVEIEKFEDEGERYRINALVWVERESQRKILLGKQGEAMKQSASEARKAMMEFFDKRVHLEVWVKVKQSWAVDEANLARLGYAE